MAVQYAVYATRLVWAIGSSRRLTNASLFSYIAVGPQRLEETGEEIRQRALVAAAEKAAKSAAEKAAAASASAAGASAEPAAVSAGKKTTKKADGNDDGYYKNYSTVVVPAAQMQEATPWLDGHERTYVVVLAMCVCFVAVCRYAAHVVRRGTGLFCVCCK